ncbi:homeobox protein NANOG [Nematolebias whitei]|uniref:homeobox protein NANOG n=1 Tax=Nematolebias whitei TaxID=451745 RepID=UPI00189C0AED|nr:homeobox protein NANOG [Nematolebias whitei]
MEDWKTQVAYFNSYHAYGFLYQSEPRAENQTGSSENRLTDSSSYTDGPTQILYSAATSGRIGESQHHRESGLVYVGGTPTDHLLPGPYEGDGTDLRRVRSGDTEARTTPDSWGSVSSREGSLLQTDLSIWPKKDDLEGIARSPEDNRDVSSSVVEDPQALVSSPTSPNVPLSISKTSLRTTFSPSQLEALSRSFSAQKYLNPAEMKDLANQTGLTYKQVKTWFQNRRMKLRKCQRDISWASDHYAFFTKMFAICLFQYPVDGRPQLWERYNQHAVEAAYKKTPHDLAYYLGTSSAGFPHWSSNSPQTTRWPMTPGGNPYIPSMFNSSNFVHGSSSESEDGNPAVGQDSVNAAVVPYVNQ